MSEVVTILAPSRDEAFEILDANYGNRNRVIRVSSFQDYFQFVSVPNIESSVDNNMDTGRLNDFTAYHPADDDPVYVLVAIVD